MGKPEAKIESAVSKYAQKLGWMVFKFSSPGHKGVPDRILFRCGVTLLIEFKTPTGRLTKLQKKCHEAFDDQDFTVLIIDNIEVGKKALDEYGEIEMMTDKPPGLGRPTKRKDEALATLHCRVPVAMKEHWKAFAKKSEEYGNLSDLAIELLNAKTGYVDTPAKREMTADDL